MTVKLRGYAAKTAQSDLASFTFERREPRPDDVVIDILYCGVCHSDLHTARNEWGNTMYPVVPGHEIIGRVKSVGADVKKFKVGDYAAIGCMVDSCQECDSCKDGLEQYCSENLTWTYNSIDRHDGLVTYGGYSEAIVAREKFVLRVPEALDIKSAAPLLCAGITTYSPLKHWKVGPGQNVAVIGLGGLGHMGVKFGKAMGANVTLFTRSKGKEEDAKRLGAGNVVLSTDPEQMKAVANKFDFILDTVPNPHDFNPYLQTLKRDGALVTVGLLVPIEPALAAGLLISGRRVIGGSLIGGIEETQEMLDFCAKTGVTSDVEMINIQDINTAYERMLRSDVKYRFVIDMQSLKNEKAG
jgi:uncharacterized zinc-type alcohol dehydrogenase-like protein